METNETKSATPQELQEISQKIGVSLQWVVMNRPESLDLCRSFLNGCLGQINNIITHK